MNIHHLLKQCKTNERRPCVTWSFSPSVGIYPAGSEVIYTFTTCERRKLRKCNAKYIVSVLLDLHQTRKIIVAPTTFSYSISRFNYKLSHSILNLTLNSEVLLFCPHYWTQNKMSNVKTQERKWKLIPSDKCHVVCFLPLPSRSSASRWKDCIHEHPAGWRVMTSFGEKVPRCTQVHLLPACQNTSYISSWCY